jgi:HSP20 family protein
MPLEIASGQPFKNLTSQVNKLLDQMNKGYYGFYPTEQWTPSVNLYETESTYHVCVDLSGVEKRKIDIEVVDQRLTLRGSRAVPTCPAIGGNDLQNRRVRVHLMEIDHGAFSREVELPEDVMKEEIAATYRNGMLWIELPKKRTSD